MAPVRLLIAVALALAAGAGVLLLHARGLVDVAALSPWAETEAQERAGDGEGDDDDDEDGDDHDDDDDDDDYGDDDDDDAPVVVVEVRGGERVLVLPEGSAEASGLLSSPLRASSWRERAAVLGSVLDASPLLEDVAALRDADLRLRLSGERLSRLGERFARLEALYRESGSVRLAEVEAAGDALRAEEGASESVALARARTERRIAHRWGEALARHVREGSDVVRRLERREAALVQAPMPGEALAGGPAEAAVAGEARPLEPLGAGFAEVPGMPADAGLFLAPGGGLRPGLALEVSFAVGGGAVEGVDVPGSAVVFHDGRAWIYLDLGGSRFVRRALAGARRTERGWFAAGPSPAPGERAVVRGAQMLLAEEFRARIMREDDD